MHDNVIALVRPQRQEARIRTVPAKERLTSSAQVSGALASRRQG
jgi:hypothetical protein